MEIILVITLIGLITGSFLEAFTYRIPREINVSKGRSKCVKCKKTISWYDNIPLLSFLILKGKCRNCHKPISIRCPAIEIGTAILFVIIYINQNIIINNIAWLPNNFYSLLYLLFLAILLIAIFIIDLEHQIIPDFLVFIGLLITLLLMLFFNSELIYVHLFAGASAALALLFLNLITLGKGMGLGDVKFALFAGTVLGFPLILLWLLMAFIIGAVIGVLLIITRFASLRDKIAFGPFLVISFLIVLLTGEYLYGIFWI